jgi:type IV pilus assembly protein PilC
MPVYAFRGCNALTHADVSGERFSDSAAALAAALRKEQIVPITIREAKSARLDFPLWKRVSQVELALFTRQFSVMLQAGLPLIQGLSAIAQQHTNTEFRTILEQVRNEVESGAALSKAMARYPKVFDPLYTNMIAAGESGGVLDTILLRLGSFIEKMVKLKRALRAALLYPATLSAIATAVVAAILWKVVPVFSTLFSELGVELPLLTRLVIALSRLIETRIFLFILFAVLAAIGMRSYYRTNSGRRLIDRILLKMPIMGKVLRKIVIARFTRTLATLLTSGVPILEAMNITANTAGNAILEDSIHTLQRRVESGGSLADAMRHSGFFPPMVTQMISAGESAGEIDSMLIKIADYYEEESDATMANLLTILEPFLMLAMGIIVGGIVISMYLPLFKMIRILSG